VCVLHVSVSVTSSTTAGDKFTSGNGSLMRLAPVATFYARPERENVRTHVLVLACMNACVCVQLRAKATSSTPRAAVESNVEFEARLAAAMRVAYLQSRTTHQARCV
jgi:hypothetical protein